jgi:hypothetical protein
MQQAQANTLIASLFFHIRSEIEKKLDSEAKKRKRGLSTTAIARIVQSALDNRIRTIRKEKIIKGFPSDHGDVVRAAIKTDVAHGITQVFGTLPLGTNGNLLLEDIAVEMMLREYFGPLKCGLVVAGFGEKEYLPSLVSYELEGAANGLPRKRVFGEHRIGVDSEACIMPFAQQESVQHFMQGIDPSLLNFMQKTTAKVVRGAIDLVLNKVATINQPAANALKQAIDPDLNNLLQGLSDEWSKERRNYWRPIVEIVTTLPKDELAVVAEALVSLTRFKRRVTPARETVGGPIDVAVITKGDGFIWLRRKTYYDQALNPRED